METPVDCDINPSECRLFFNLCYNCHKPGGIGGTSAQPLKRCGGCQLIAYCSRDCQKDHRTFHKPICKEFSVVNGKNVLHTTGSWTEHISGLRKRAAQLPTFGSPPLFVNPRVCNICHNAHPERLTDCECGGVCYCSKVCADTDKSHGIVECSYFSTLARSYRLYEMFCSYPLGLMYALETLPPGDNLIPLENRITLCVHVISSRHIFNPFIPWEGALIHKLPKLKLLKLDFIIQDKSKTPVNFIDTFSERMCKDCKDNDRIITPSVHEMPYHMFFSSLKYTEPDVVVIYGNKQEMLENVDDNLHTEISYRNMLNNHDTILVLMDATEDLLREGIINVNNAQPVHELSAPQINKNRGHGSLEERLDTDGAVINERYYFTCLRKTEEGQLIVTDPIPQILKWIDNHSVSEFGKKMKNNISSTGSK